MNDTEWEEVNGKVVSILEDKKIVEEGDLIICYSILRFIRVKVV
jgi:hypothetical protein